MSKTLERNLYLNEVDITTITNLTKEIININDEDDKLEKEYVVEGNIYNRKPIKLYIDSPGGAVYQALGFVNIIENSKTPIHTIVTGFAASAGFLISLHGVKRYAHQHSSFMYHQLAYTKWYSKFEDHKEDLAESERLHNKLCDIIVSKTKIKRKELDKNDAKKKDWWMDSKEALKLGVIDEIL
jgi:ATP-dependent Clp protease protease subunit